MACFNLQLLVSERTTEMRFHQKDNIVLRVARGRNSRWDVREPAIERPLASFDTERDALAYANDLLKAKAGSQVVFDAGYCEIRCMAS